MSNIETNMKLEDQVVSLELAKKLKELGVKKKSLFYWIIDTIGTIYDLPVGSNSFWSAFTVAELGEMLPWDITISRNIEKQWHINFMANGFPEIISENSSIMSESKEADARAKMLIYLIENDLIKKE